MFTILLGVLAGVLAGGLLGGAGAGGSLLALPIAHHLLGLAHVQAAVTSLSAVAVAAAVGAARSARAGQVSARAVLLVGGPAALAATVGARLSAGVAAPVADGLLAGCLLAALAATWSGGPAVRRAIQARAVSGVAALAGVASGLAGVGAGVLMTPVLMLSGLPERRAGSTALVLVAVLAVAALVPRLLAGARPDAALTGVLTVAMAGGVVAGHGIADRAPAHRMRQAVALVLVLALASTVVDATGRWGIS